MDLYTLIFYFGEGRIITQSYSNSMESAASKCIGEWDISDTAAKITESERQSMLNQVEKAEFTDLENLENIWVAGIYLREKQVVLELVKTEKPYNKNRKNDAKDARLL